MDLRPMVQFMVEKKASDLHIRANKNAVIRVDGVIIHTEFMLSSEDTSRLAHSMMNDSQIEVFSKRHEIDLAYEISDIGRFRVNIFRQLGLVNIALRNFGFDLPTIESLNLPPAVSKVAQNNSGIVLVTGTTGSGKTNTLAAIVDYINTNYQKNIITIEDPVEFIHKDKKSIVSQRELGFDTLSFADALKNVVRQDPDVVLIGEMRDSATVMAAITAAQLGHLVLSTLHTINASQSINRILDFFPQHQQDQQRMVLADILRAVLSQRLLPVIDGGRVPAMEILVNTSHVKDLIYEKKFSEINAAIKDGAYYGMQTFNQSLLSLYAEGKITAETALETSGSPKELMLSMSGIKTSAESSRNVLHQRDAQEAAAKEAAEAAAKEAAAQEAAAKEAAAQEAAAQGNTTQGDAAQEGWWSKRWSKGQKK
ncbi:MAG: PilT/PilU family type 4a pilus ATPase [Endomicrobia bacterium]|nr:PilT/PilU family type 4a pilus ATPase [Endomicrobiia bacterium]